VQPTAAGTRL